MKLFAVLLVLALAAPLLVSLRTIPEVVATACVPKWLTQRSLCVAIPLLEPGMQNRPMYSKFPCPRFEAESFAAECDKPGVALVGRLLLQSGPAAIPRLVIPIVIDAVELQTIWTFTHIFKEVLKTPVAVIVPAFTDIDTPASVSFPARPFVISAAAQHFIVRSECFTGFSVDPMPVSSRAFANVRHKSPLLKVGV